MAWDPRAMLSLLHPGCKRAEKMHQALSICPFPSGGKVSSSAYESVTSDNHAVSLGLCFST